MAHYIYIAAAFAVGLAINFFFGHLAKYTALTVYEVPNDMLPIDRELLKEIISESAPVCEPEAQRGARYRRQRIRLDLETVQVRLQRLLANAARPKYWARYDRRLNRRNRLQHPPEIAAGINKVIKIESEVRQRARWLLFRIWLWNITGFQRRDWGPVPDMRNFNVNRVLEAYDELKMATIDLVRLNGEATIAEELANVM